MKMSRAHSQDQTNIPLIVTTNEVGAKPSSSTATSLDSAFKTKSCRSFVRQSKLNNEHRNKSVPQNLQVCVCACLCAKSSVYHLTNSRCPVASVD